MRWSIPRGSASQATPSAPGRSPTSARSTLEWTQSSPGTTCAPARNRSPRARLRSRAATRRRADHQAGARDVERLRADRRPLTDRPGPAERKNGGFARLQGRRRGLDAGQLRGGTHFEYSFIPGQTVPALGQATLRGIDMVAWYTVAWFDSYVKCTATRWRPADASSSPTAGETTSARRGRTSSPADPNLYSFYFRSRYSLRAADGSLLTCDDMRAGCRAWGPTANRRTTRCSPMRTAH